MSLDFLEEFYHRSIRNQQSFPEGYVDIAEILSHAPSNHLTNYSKDQIDQHFIVAESTDKLTLFNTDFAVWLVPELVHGQAVTHGYIALHQPNGDYSPELAFEATGKYNESGCILTALQLYLNDIKDTEDALRSFRFTQDNNPPEGC